MAYQNIGIPRFYVNDVMWMLKMNAGSVSGDTEVAWLGSGSIFNLNPTVQYRHFGAINTEYCLTAPLSNGYNYVAWLGHDFDSVGWRCHPKINNQTHSADSGINYNQNAIPSHNGFTFQFFGVNTYPEINLCVTTGGYLPSGGAKCASISAGKYYDMPHSPDLKLTMTREMDGVKRIRTKGGTDLVKQQYTGNPAWGDAGAWELYEGTPEHQSLSRSGRRVWDLSFSYLQDSDLFPEISNLEEHGTDYDSSSSIGKTLLDDNSFYSQVIHKTNGGQLPFIFQPDKNDNTNFAICKFDQKSFQFKQVANGVYNVKLEIREVC